MGVKQYIENYEREKYTLDQICEQMSGAEIARELNISRQAVGQTIKRAMGKVYKELKKQNKDLDAFEIAIGIADGFNVDDPDYTKFFRLFPPKVRKEIEEAGKKRMPGIK